MNRRLRAGVIGVGSMGKNHARVYSELLGVDLVGVADPRAEICGQVARQCGTKAYSDHRELLRQDLDLVSVVVPTSLHLAVATDAAEAGVNVLLEKPISDSIENASQIIEKCRQRSVKLTIGHIERFNPVVQTIKNQISSLSVISINISRLGLFPPRIRDVGVVVDLATHDIDILRYLTGSEFKSVHSMIMNGLIDDHEDTALLAFEMENGVLCHLNTNWLTPFKLREISVAAREKFVKGWLMEQKVSEYQSANDGGYMVRDVPVPYGEPLKIEVGSFVDAVANGKSPSVTGEDGIKALEIALRCLQEG